MAMQRDATLTWVNGHPSPHRHWDRSRAQRLDGAVPPVTPALAVPLALLGARLRRRRRSLCIASTPLSHDGADNDAPSVRII